MDNNEFNGSGERAEDAVESGPGKSARQWAMGCHLIALAGYAMPLASLIGPLVIWLLKREEDAFIDDQGRESVNFQITVMIGAFVSLVLIPLLGLGVLLLGLVVIFDLVCVIMGAIKASEGAAYRYPVCIRFVK